MPPIKTRLGVDPLARVLYLGRESIYPGWYVQHYSDDRLVSFRLELSEDADAADAVTEAAASLGCQESRIQLGGADWPRQRHGFPSS